MQKNFWEEHKTINSNYALLKHPPIRPPDASGSGRIFPLLKGD
jgi:hypothetical protein